MKATQLRKQIRQHIADQLQQLKTDYPNLQIFSERRAYIPEGVSQYVQIWFAKGSPEVVADDARRDESDLVIQIFMQSAEGVDDPLDERGDKVETLLDENHTLGGLVENFEQAEWRYGQGDKEGWFWLGLGYKLQYETEIN